MLTPSTDEPPAPAPADGWVKVKQVVADALEGGHRAGSAWVATACAGDPALLREVESLLAAHEAAGGFMDTPEPARAGAVGRPSRKR